MSGSAYRDEAEGVYDINVTPLVDVVLVLLIIFMVTAPAIAKRGISFDEPKTVSGAPVDSKLQITLDTQGQLYIGQEKVAPDAAKAELARAVNENPEIKAVITADKAVPHGEVMATVDMIKLAGVRKFAFTSRKKTVP